MNSLFLDYQATISKLERRIQELEESIRLLQDSLAKTERKAILSESKAKVYHEQLLFLADTASQMVLAQKTVAKGLE